MHSLSDDNNLVPIHLCWKEIELAFSAKLVPEAKQRNSAFRYISNIDPCRNSLALNINFKNNESFEILSKYKFQGFFAS